MPFALVIIGIVLVVTGAKGTQAALAKELRADFTGNQNFLYWLFAIGSVGALGSIAEFRTFSRLFMTLILVAMVLSNEGVFNKFMEAIKTGPIAPELPNEQKPEMSLGVDTPIGGVGLVKGGFLDRLGKSTGETIQNIFKSDTDNREENIGKLKMIGRFFGFGF